MAMNGRRGAMVRRKPAGCVAVYYGDAVAPVLACGLRQTISGVWIVMD